MMQDWHVKTAEGGWQAVAYEGNGGFGPVNVMVDGTYRPVEYRHTAVTPADEKVPTACPLCNPEGAVGHLRFNPHATPPGWELITD